MFWLDVTCEVTLCSDVIVSLHVIRALLSLGGNVLIQVHLGGSVPSSRSSVLLSGV